jgi:hypothetical protein
MRGQFWIFDVEGYGLIGWEERKGEMIKGRGEYKHERRRDWEGIEEQMRR